MNEENLQTPSGLLRSAIKAVPAVKYALGIGGIVAVIVIVVGFKIDFRIAVFGVVIMFVLMTVLVVFARLSTESKSSFHAPAIVFTWFAMLLTMAIASAVFTSVFWGRPADWKNLIEVSTKSSNSQDVRRVEDKIIPQTNSQPSPPFAPANQNQPNSAEGLSKPPASSKKSVLAVTNGSHKSRALPETIDSGCCNWVLGTWRGSVQRQYQKTSGDAGSDYERTCEGDWIESYEFIVASTDSSRVDGTASYSMPGAKITCHETAKRDGHEISLDEHRVDARSFHYPLKISASDIPNSVKMTINGIDWIVEKTSDTQVRASCLGTCDLSLYTFQLLNEPITQIVFKKF